MAILQLRLIDAGGRKPYTNAAPATTNGEVVVYEQLQAAIQSIAWKDDVRAASVVNVTLATPGAAIDGVTLAVNDRVLLKSQTTSTENGIYVWNGAAVPLTRAVDADTFDELEAAIVTASEGTAGAGTTWRQTQVNGVIGTNNLLWTSFQTAAPAASETVSGIAEIATQAETDAGTDDLRIVTPLKLATYSGRAKRFNQTVGDGSATSITVTHNLGTKAVAVDISEVGGSFREVITEIQKTTTNSITVLFDTAPASGAYLATVIA
jgi:hypothetical protein